MQFCLATTASPFPFCYLALAAHNTEIAITFDDSFSKPVFCINGVYATDLFRSLVRAAEVYESKDPLDLAAAAAAATTHPDVIATLDSLDDRLWFQTFLSGHTLTTSDWIIWGALRGNIKCRGLLRDGGHPHLLRWFSYIESLSVTQRALSLLSTARAQKLRSSRIPSGFALGLPHAIDGQVVTRFPPEPSGYLHIGHAKAVVLNQYFANMYHGQFLVRFDDTNPSKEKTEYEQAIIEDLHLLGVSPTKVSHTSDYFDQLHALAVDLIRSGQAYADDTDSTHLLSPPCSCSPNSHGPLTQMAFDRFHGIPSSRRNTSVEDNLSRFEAITQGSPDVTHWCIRAKIDMANPNKAMRDPVIYRYNATPHHRTGQWSVYPTYDFACPVIDSIEGVTHTLRSTEYRDRNSQYRWMIDALGLRSVHVWDFSRLNFVHTVLSKRKLQQFVDKGLVHGWDDPRFPTIRGMQRRGLTAEALRQFMLQQGPSQAILLLEWDSLWSLNKKVIDPIAPRHWAIVKEDMVSVIIKGGPEQPYCRTLPKHKKNPSVGEKQTIYSNACSFQEQEEITLMNWGNAIVRQRTLDPSSEKVVSLVMELHLDGDFRTTHKKITWLSNPAVSVVEAVLLDYGHLITKKKLEKGDNWEDYVPAVSEFREEAIADANVADLVTKTQRIIQFERKGFYSFDGIDDRGKYAFIKVPDGRSCKYTAQ
ncbi:glutamyl-tRNA synthetase [Desarmillaria tabescens]|uniref:glutamate--tRNA ligase n=1 Tax=Armillaria tabescens TaxID=1929756 RepID=A0AA39JWZ0_ARMTA|nr:glutamyl-tRNA synthetase [Desarmillaria tabescens]KAK0450308.1 glutamyl-tRNA synthetase [Desarmillaria tabescens]